MTGGIMIDRAGTPDRDDAIWAEEAGDGWDLAVHVACAADTVRPGSAADQRAARQAQTLYLPDKTISMLPRSSEHAATLASGRECATLRVTWHLAANGTASGVRVSEGRLRDPVALDYAAATAAISDRAHPQHQPLAAAHAASRVLLARRRQEGALAIYDLIRGWASNGDGGLRELAASERNAAYVIVAEFMVAANTIIAGFCVAGDIPVLFRVHQPAAAAPPREQLIGELAVATEGDGEEWRRQAARQRLGHLLRPAAYSVHASEHYGLRLPWYCHATSPLRRYADLVSQRQIQAMLRGERPPHDADEMSQFAALVNDRLRVLRERRAERNKERTVQQRRAGLATAEYQRLDGDEFFRLLKLAAKERLHSPGLEAEFLRRAAADMLLARDAYPVLTAAGPEWDASRAALMAWLARHPEHAVTLAANHAVNLGMDGIPWEESHAGTLQAPRFSARAGISHDGVVTWSATRIARRKDTARQQAALSLLASLARQPDPSVSDPAPATPAPATRKLADTTGRSPVMAVNELSQAGVIRGLDWAFAQSGPSHDPEFACTATATWSPDGRPLEASGTSKVKKDAKAAAARRLLEMIADGEQPDRDAR
jgi:ribonuclease R